MAHWGSKLEGDQMRRKGFTLVEVIVAIVLIGLVGIAFIPAIGMGFSRLITSMNITVDAYDVQGDIERILEEKRHLEPNGTGTAIITAFGVPVSGHLVTYTPTPSKTIYIFQPKSSIEYTLLEITSEILLKIVGQSPTPKEISMFNESGVLNGALTFQVSESGLKISDPSEHLVNVYKWYTTMPMVYKENALLEGNYIVKEWNAARAVNTYEQYRTNGITPNIQNDPSYNELTLTEIKSGYALTDTEMINRFGNRYVYYSVTPYAISGRIGKEKLSNPIYIKAPRIEIESAKFSSTDDKVVEITFKNDINEAVTSTFMSFPESLGKVLSAVRSTENHKILLVTFENPLPRNQSVSGAVLKKGAVFDKTYGNIDIWYEDAIENPFNIGSADGSISIESINLSQTSLAMAEDISVKLEATLLPANITSKDVDVTLSDPTVAQIVQQVVEDNKIKFTIKGLKAGKTVLSVATLDGRIEQKCEITVVEADLLLGVDGIEGVETTGISVNLWKDYSGFGRNLTPSSGSLPQLGELDGKPAVTFTKSGATLIYKQPNNFVDAPLTLFIVGKPTTELSEGVLFKLSDDEQTAYQLSKTNTNYEHQFSGVKFNTTGNGKRSLLTSEVVENMFKHRINQVGVLEGDINGSSLQSNAISLGGFDGSLYEVQLYGGALTVSERLAIEEMLIDKWMAIKSWSFNLSSEGWTDVFGIMRLAVEEGHLIGSVNRRNAYIKSDENLGIEMTSDARIMIRLKNTSGASHARIGLQMNSTTTFEELSVPLNMNSDFNEYVLELPSSLSGTLDQIRFYPGLEGSSGQFELDYIRVIR